MPAEVFAVPGPFAPVYDYLPFPGGAAQEDRTLLLRDPGSPDPLVFGPEDAMLCQQTTAGYPGVTCPVCGVRWASWLDGCWACPEETG